MAHYSETKCYSGLHRGWTLEEGLTHYLGCLKLRDRESFLAGIPRDDKLRAFIIRDERRIAKLRDKYETDGHRTEYGKLLASLQAARALYRRAKPLNPLSASATKNDDNDVSLEDNEIDLDDFTANVIYFKNKQPYDHPSLEDSFPNQRLHLSILLKENQLNNPLMWDCEADMIRYFHIPANNMSWIEDIIARYYREDKPDLSGPYRKRASGEAECKTRMLLRPQFWRRLQHGTRRDFPPHARYMRPRCDSISIDPTKVANNPKNIALFTPYLHWETDRRRLRAANIIRGLARTGSAAVEDVVLDAQTTAMKGTFDRETSDGSINTITTTALHRTRANPKIKGQTLLGRILFFAAALYEAMEAHADENLLEKYITANPPLHPRRTLDQSYYSSLGDTRKRDRDQLVYRDTAPSPKFMHHMCLKSSYEGIVRNTCRQCRDDVTKVPRVLMVDQLWMWILDENTIITAFPSQWGRNVDLPSAVHKRIQTRLSAGADDAIRSVYDLAIVIIEQCSGACFDPPDAPSLQPRMIDIFSTVIGKVTHRQAIASDHFWDYARWSALRRSSRRRIPMSGKFHRMESDALDIHREGELLRELADILDELFMITQVKSQEQNVCRMFAKLVIHNLEPVQLPPMTVSRDRTSISRGKLPYPEYLNRDEVSEEHDRTWTLASTGNLLENVQDHINELKHLQLEAENTSNAMKNMMDLKQQKAGVVALESIRQGEEALSQGRSIMLFTIVTIIFLPLSFFTSLFGMNATELTGSSGDYNFNKILVYMIITIISLLLAFSGFARALVSFVINYTWTWIITRTSVYSRWVYAKLDGETFDEWGRTLIDEMKDNVLRADTMRKIAEIERKEAIDRERERARDPTSLVGRVDRATRSKRIRNATEGNAIKMETRRIQGHE